MLGIALSDYRGLSDKTSMFFRKFNPLIISYFQKILFLDLFFVLTHIWHYIFLHIWYGIHMTKRNKPASTSVLIGSTLGFVKRDFFLLQRWSAPTTALGARQMYFVGLIRDLGARVLVATFSLWTIFISTPITTAMLFRFMPGILSRITDNFKVLILFYYINSRKC